MQLRVDEGVFNDRDVCRTSRSTRREKYSNVLQTHIVIVGQVRNMSFFPNLKRNTRTRTCPTITICVWRNLLYFSLRVRVGERRTGIGGDECICWQKVICDRHTNKQTLDEYCEVGALAFSSRGQLHNLYEMAAFTPSYQYLVSLASPPTTLTIFNNLKWIVLKKLTRTSQKSLSEESSIWFMFLIKIW